MLHEGVYLLTTSIWTDHVLKVQTLCNIAGWPQHTILEDLWGFLMILGFLVTFIHASTSEDIRIDTTLLFSHDYLSLILLSHATMWLFLTKKPSLQIPIRQSRVCLIQVAHFPGAHIRLSHGCVEGHNSEGTAENRSLPQWALALPSVLAILF